MQSSLIITRVNDTDIGLMGTGQRLQIFDSSVIGEYFLLF